MCGITGFIGQGTQTDLEKMTNCLKHRGPDDQGIFVHDNIHLGHTRLSIIDLSPAGHQPMSNGEKNVWITFNGEIYNFRELKKELLDKGYKFQSNTDTEVIIHLYREYGEKAFAKMNGMFALAIYDLRDGKLILARDRMGKKPLYWGMHNFTFLFGSELKSLISHPSFNKELDLHALNKYLALEYVPTPHTIYKNTYKLEPGSYLVYESQKIRKEKFWQLNFANSELNFEQSLSKLDELLAVSVKDRLVADVPLGIFLSGGLDSSSIAYYAQTQSSQRIKTFAIGFKEKSYDESAYARKVAGYLDTEHYEDVLPMGKTLELIPRITDILDEPLADYSILPTFLLSEFTRQHVTVALGGDGGDELFAGYPTFQADRFSEVYARMPEALRKGLVGISDRLGASSKNYSFGFKLQKFNEGFQTEAKYRHLAWLGAMSKQSRSQLFRTEIWEQLSTRNEYEDTDVYLQESDKADKGNRELYLYLRTYLMDRVLVKVDRASMAHGLEIRAPLLDYRLVEFAYSIPYSYKFHGFQTKYIFKKLMSGKLPAEIINRSKKGFGIPLSQWLRSDLKSFCQEVLSQSKIQKQGLFDYQHIERLMKDHFSGRRDNRMQLWTLIVFQLWQDKWGN